MRYQTEQGAEQGVEPGDIVYVDPKKAYMVVYVRENTRTDAAYILVDLSTGKNIYNFKDNYVSLLNWIRTFNAVVIKNSAVTMKW